MKLVKALIATKTTKVKIPVINVIECEEKIMDHIKFEYDMIQRAREAEIILNQILYNGMDYPSKSYTNTIANSMASLLWKFKSSNHKFSATLPIIKVEECTEDCHSEEDLENEMLERAREAAKRLSDLLGEDNTCCIQRQRTVMLHLWQSEPIICGANTKTREQSKFMGIYETLTRRKAKKLRVRSCSYSPIPSN